MAAINALSFVAIFDDSEWRVNFRRDGRGHGLPTTDADDTLATARLMVIAAEVGTASRRAP
jgi:hypothetical protein